MKIGKLLCKIGVHRYTDTPILATLDTYWMQGGQQCAYCKKRRISFADASILVHFAYKRGHQRSETKLLAYGNCGKAVAELYGKSYVQRMLDDMPTV